jgi:hypothetical protein
MDQERQHHTTGWAGQDVRLTRASACCIAPVHGVLGEAILSAAWHKQDVRRVEHGMGCRKRGGCRGPCDVGRRRFGIWKMNKDCDPDVRTVGDGYPPGPLEG